MSWSINVSGSKIQNQSNCKKTVFSGKYDWIYLAFQWYCGMNQQNNDSGFNQKTDVLFMN